MVNILNSILWFLLHSNNKTIIHKIYYKQLHYWEYKVYNTYKLLCIINIKYKINTFSSIDSQKQYSKLIMYSSNEILEINKEK